MLQADWLLLRVNHLHNKGLAEILPLVFLLDAIGLRDAAPAP